MNLGAPHGALLMESPRNQPEDQLSGPSLPRRGGDSEADGSWERGTCEEQHTRAGGLSGGVLQHCLLLLLLFYF